MAWGKSDDTVAFHPRVMRLGCLDDERQLNEAWGFVHRAFSWSAQGYTDGFIAETMLPPLAGGRGPILIKVAQKAGIIGKRVARHPDTGEAGWFLILDVDELLHMRTKAEVDWEKKYRAQLRDIDIYGPVRLRDGDACRYCGQVVIWKNNRNGKGGVLEHVIPGEDELVVACRRCNGLKQERTPEQAGMVLLPVPKEPYYSDYTRDLLTRNGFTVPPARPQGAADPDPGAHPTDAADAATGARREVELEQPPAQPQARPHAAPDQVRNKHGTTDRGLPDQLPPGTGRDGPGSGQVGHSLLLTPDHPPDSSSSSRPRGARGRRKPPPTSA